MGSPSLKLAPIVGAVGVNTRTAASFQLGRRVFQPQGWAPIAQHAGFWFSAMPTGAISDGNFCG